MNKDVIYIDTEDDITAIIGKIKASDEKIVALVPPKRVGVLQSAVNLRLLARAAKGSSKHLALITNNKALAALAGAAKIPVAKNLQSKPEMPEIAALEIDEGEDVIDGAQLPIGELARTSDIKTEEDINDDIKEIDIENDEPKYVPSVPVDSVKPKRGVKVPDFAKFRKKLLIGVIAGIAFITFLVWAIWFAPAATVVITAKTEPSPITASLNLGGAGSTDISSNTLQTVKKTMKKDISVEFTATGKKDVGEKAEGTITIKNCDRSDSIIIEAGTLFISNSGLRYTNSSQIVVPGLTGSASLCRATGTGAGTVDVGVTAEAAGTSYNIGESDYSISGVSGDVYASGSAMSGGTSRIATVVTAADVQKASEELVDQSTSDIKDDLTAQFNNGEIVIEDSFDVDRKAAKSSPAIGEEANGKVKLTSEATFSMLAISKSEMQTYLKDALNEQIDEGQRIYDDGISKVELSDYQKGDKTPTVNISTVGQIGPDIDKDDVKERVKGKRYGDAQALVDEIQGVSSVDVKFSYFWVRTIPGDVNKIDVEFILANG